MDAAGFQDRHSLLHPQQRPRRIDLKQEKAGPAGIASLRREQFGQGWARGFGQSPALARSLENRAFEGRLPAQITGASDKGQTCRHTTHNAYVLLLFL